MGCKKDLRPVYYCQHILPMPRISCPSKTEGEGYSCAHRTEIHEVLDGKCPHMVRNSKEVKNDDFENVIQITCAHLSPFGGRCSCALAIAEAEGNVSRQLSLFEKEGV